MKFFFGLLLVLISTNSYAWTCDDGYGSQMQVIEDDFTYGNYPEDSRILILSGPVAAGIAVPENQDVYNRDEQTQSWGVRVNSVTNNTEIRVKADPEGMFKVQMGGRYQTSLRTSLVNNTLKLTTSSGDSQGSETSNWVFNKCL